jgi:hypothetical protein
VTDMWHPYGERKAVCKACGAILQDAESCDAKPDYHHPKGSTCVHDHCYPPRESYVLFVPKKIRRANKRGARLGARMTRRAARG